MPLTPKEAAQGFQVIGGSMMMTTAAYSGPYIGPWLVFKGLDEIQAGIRGGDTIVYGTARGVGVPELLAQGIDVVSAMPETFIAACRTVTKRGVIYVFESIGKATSEAAKAAAKNPEEVVVAEANVAAEELAAVEAAEAGKAAPRTGQPDPRLPAKPVELANPGRLSAADYAQLEGLSFGDKVRQMRAILNRAIATRSPQQVEQLGPFRFQEMLGPNGEEIFMGQGAPATTTVPTVTVITPQGQTYRMRPLGVTGVASPGPPLMVSYDLQLGNAELMVR